MELVHTALADLLLQPWIDVLYPREEGFFLMLGSPDAVIREIESSCRYGQGCDHLVTLISHMLACNEPERVARDS